MSKGIVECKVCHREFALVIEDHYEAKDPVHVIPIWEPSGPTKGYDAIDCPHCGCQNLLQERKPVWDGCPCYYGICDECLRENSESEE